jgi:hypothetical protein
VVWAPVALAAPAATRVRLWAGFGFARGRRPRLRKCRVGPPGCRGQGYTELQGMRSAGWARRCTSTAIAARSAPASRMGVELHRRPRTPPSAIRGVDGIRQTSAPRPPDTPATCYRHTPATGYRLSTCLIPESRARENPPEGVVPARPSKQIRPRAESKTRRKRRWATGAQLGTGSAARRHGRRWVPETPRRTGSAAGRQGAPLGTGNAIARAPAFHVFLDGETTTGKSGTKRT